MPRKSTYQTAAERQKAYRARKRNAPRVTKCPRCQCESTIPVDEDMAKQFGVYCTVLCFACNGLVSETGAVWSFHGRAHEVLYRIAL